MNYRQYYILSIMLCGSLVASPQASLDSLLSRAIQNSKAIIGARQYYENTRMASRTNLYPENPEVQYAHLWGSPAELGNRTDFTVSQSFEYPGVYVNRSKLSKAGVEKVSHLVDNIRQETMLEAKHLWIEKVYLNRKQNVLRKRISEAERVSEYLSLQFENGEISKLRYNKVLLLQASLSAEMDLLEAESRALDASIARIAGYPAPVIDDTSYYIADLAILDSVFAASLADPLYQAYQQEVEMHNLQRQLTRASGMPKFKTGYYSEKVLGFHLQGIQLGITIPLWENANKVKTATGEVISAELAAEKFRSDETTSIRQLYTRYQSFQKQKEELSRALEYSNDPEVLALAVQTGEISVVEYFYETDLYYSVLFDLLLAEKELLRAQAELTKYEF